MNDLHVVCLAVLLMIPAARAAGEGGAVVFDPVMHTVTMADARGDLAVRLDCDGRCCLDRVRIRGRDVVARDTGVCTAIKAGGQWSTTRQGITSPRVAVNGSEVIVEAIEYQCGGIGVRERWTFTVGADRICWRISRTYLNAGQIEDTYFPGWDFASMETWTGGLLDTGGVAWCRYLPSGASYGTHAGTVTFFDTGRSACLRITPDGSPGTSLAARFSHQAAGPFSFAESVTTGELATGHHLHRFNKSLDVWAPFHVEPGTVTVDLTMQVLDDEAVRGRGTFAGLDGRAVGDVLDTIGRYGVIDRRITGGNGWLSGYVCLHEPFFAGMGLAIDDPDYTANLAASLDEWRDHAQKPDGRVMSRWHHDSGDRMVPGTYDAATGFYECGWGYLLDSQPDYVINVSEQFDLSGDLPWLRAHKKSCERALDWLLARDTAGNGLVEMMTDSQKARKSSDWIDIVWASWENALVNAELFEALNLWSDRETILGDAAAAQRYHTAAVKLRDTFRKPISQGGFWDDQNGWFAYWRDRDGSIHGDNLVTPVNFCAVAYGLSDDAQRKRILDGIEDRMRQEKLFHWPLCFLPYAKGEGANTRFPEYENGDIFLSWGELAVRAYSAENPAVAVKYVRLALDQYRKDGLSFQRYLRRDQRGAGDDILAGNSMIVAGLYRDIYGIRPQWNRLRLDPHLVPELEGTVLRYRLRGKTYQITPGMGKSEIAVEGQTLRSTGSFAFDVSDDRIACFAGASDKPAITVGRVKGADLAIDIDAWPDAISGPCRWTVSCTGEAGPLHVIVGGLMPGSDYHLEVDGVISPARVTADAGGAVTIDLAAGGGKSVRFSLVRIPPAGGRLTG